VRRVPERDEKRKRDSNDERIAILPLFPSELSDAVFDKY